MSRGLGYRFRYGILGAGAVSKSLVGRLPINMRNLGPVAATSFRVASRIANTLRAGYAARSAGELNAAAVVLVHSRPDQACSLLRMLETAEIQWDGKAVIFCDCDDAPEVRARLRARGASTALAKHFGIPGHLLVAGNGAALTAALRIARELKLKPVGILPGAPDVFDAAVTLATAAITPLIDRVAGLLRDAGLRDAEAARIASALFMQTASDYAHSGKQSWAWYSRQPAAEQIEGQVVAAGAHLGRALRELLVFGLETFAKYPDLEQELRARPEMAETQKT
jgi:hypothetical protein